MAENILQIILINIAQSDIFWMNKKQGFDNCKTLRSSLLCILLQLVEKLKTTNSNVI